MSEDKVISMEEFRKSARELSEEEHDVATSADTFDDFMDAMEDGDNSVYTAVKLVQDVDGMFAIMEQGPVYNDGTYGKAICGVVIPVSTLAGVITQLQVVDKMAKEEEQ